MRFRGRTAKPEHESAEGLNLQAASFQVVGSDGPSSILPEPWTGRSLTETQSHGGDGVLANEWDCGSWASDALNGGPV